MSGNQQRFTLGAQERLKLRNQIETLFSEGKAFSVFPLRIVFVLKEKPDIIAAPVLVGFSVPKKKLKSAVARNRIKRLLREGWRLNKHLLYAHIPEGHQLHCFIIYQNNATDSFQHIRDVVVQLMEGLIKRLPKPGL